MKSTILHLRASRFVGGPERQILRYASFDKGGPLNVVIGTFLDGGEGAALLGEARAQGIDTVGFIGEKSLIAELREYLDSHQVQLICAHGYKPFILAIIACRGRGIPVACFLRGWTGEDLKVKAYELLERTMLPLADRTVCLSETHAEQIRKRPLLRNKVSVVVNAIEPRNYTADQRRFVRNTLCERYSLATDSVILACAGRLSPEKGARYLLRALPKILRQQSKVKLLVFGDGVLREELEQEAQALGVVEAVRFTGFVPNFPDLLPGIDLLVNPSLAEQMPNVVLEAMAAGTPVVATAVGGVPEIGSGGAILQVAAGDVSALGDAIASVLVEPIRGQELRERAYGNLRQKFSPEIQKRQLHQLYSEFCPVADSTPIPESSSLPLISVVIPVRNEEKSIGTVLDGLLQQRYPAEKFEIIVADGESTDRTREIVAHYAAQSPVNIKCVSNPKRLSSAGRNAGVLASRGDVVTFIDGHCFIPSDTLLLDIVRAFEKSGAQALCRPQPLRFPGISGFQKIVADARATWLGHGRDSSIYSMNFEGFVDPSSSGATYLREVFDQVGFYDERFDACEDVEFNFRVHQAGMKAYISPRLAVYYCPRQDLSGLLRQTMRYGRGRFRLFRKHSSAFSISQVVPAALVAWILLGSVASTLLPRLGVYWALSLVPYVLALLVVAAGLGIRKGRRHFVWSSAVLFTIHLGFGLGFWWELFSSLGKSAVVGSEVIAVKREDYVPASKSAQEEQPLASIASDRVGESR